jgi:hypothetical protein
VRTVIGYDLAVAQFVAERIKLNVDDLYPCTAMGFARTGGLVAGVVFNNYRKYDIQLTAVSEDTRWLTKNVLREIFSYPYIQLGCERTTAVTGRKNFRTRKLLEGLGYKLEGVARKGLDGRQDAICYGMLKSECKWLNRTECSKAHGKVIPKSARPDSDSECTSDSQ